MRQYYLPCFVLLVITGTTALQAAQGPPDHHSDPQEQHKTIPAKEGVAVLQPTKAGNGVVRFIKVIALSAVLFGISFVLFFGLSWMRSEVSLLFWTFLVGEGVIAIWVAILGAMVGVIVGVLRWLGGKLGIKEKLTKYIGSKLATGVRLIWMLFVLLLPLRLMKATFWELVILTIIGIVIFFVQEILEKKWLVAPEKSLPASAPSMRT